MILPNPWLILALVLGFIGSNAVTYMVAYDNGVDAEVARQNEVALKGAIHVNNVNIAAGATVNEIGESDAAAKAGIAASIKPVEDFIHAYVPKDPNMCRLPISLQRVYDASGTGDALYLAPLGLEPVGAAEEVPCDRAAAIFTENNEAFRSNAQQLADIILAYDALRALYERELASLKSE